MPVDATQPVFPMPPGQAVEAVWGQAVSEHVIQRFTDPADRNAKWTTPPKGAVCETLTPQRIWVHNGLQWVDLLALYGPPYLALNHLQSGWAGPGLVYLGTVWIPPIPADPALAWQFVMQINWFAQGGAGSVDGGWFRTRIRSGGVDYGISPQRFAHDNQVTINDAMGFQRTPGQAAANMDIYGETDRAANWFGYAATSAVPAITNVRTVEEGMAPGDISGLLGPDGNPLPQADVPVYDDPPPP